MIEKIIVVAPTTAVPISTGLAVALKVLPAPSFSSRCAWRVEVGVEAEVALQLRLDVRDRLDQRQLVDGLRVVGHRAVAVDGDRHRAHAEEAERDQAEGEDRRGQHQIAAAPWPADAVGDAHQDDDDQAEPVRAEVAGDKAGKNVQRRAALARGGHDLADVAGLGGGEDFDELRDDRAGQRAAGDDRRQLPPERFVAEVGISR